MEDLKGLPLFAAVVAHELRNPLSAVKIALQTLERHAALPTKDGTRLRIALREVGTIERVLTDMLDWARPGEVELEQTTPEAIVETARHLVQPGFDEAGVNIETNVPSPPERMAADRARLGEALAEVLRNAADASRKGGTVRVTVTKNDAAVVFTVTDEGDGLSEEDCVRAFDPFFSRRARGVGLGLPRALEIVRRHGGSMDLERRLTGGARATIRLPQPDPAT
jgi:two-component system sensor histidine kinase HydH